MSNSEKKVVVAQMRPRERREWNQDVPRKKRHYPKRLQKKHALLAAVVLCLGSAAALTLHHGDSVSAVMGHLTAGFEYDDTLGRLQFVSNILPESAMVFLNSTDGTDEALVLPTSAEIAHTWSQQEPWLEYSCSGDISSCRDGEVMTIVQNRSDEYTVRILHDDGYESVYSGLDSVSIEENNWVTAGQTIGTAAGFAAFELRKDGLSVLPVFSGS